MKLEYSVSGNINMYKLKCLFQTLVVSGKIVKNVTMVLISSKDNLPNLKIGGRWSIAPLPYNFNEIHTIDIIFGKYIINFF